MNRRAFLTGVAAAAVAPAIRLPAVAAPLIEMCPVPAWAAETEVARLVAEYWTRKMQAAFLVQCDYLR